MAGPETDRVELDRPAPTTPTEPFGTDQQFRLLIEAVTVMFRLRDLMTQLIHNPIPGLDGVNAAPTFEMAAVAAVSS